MTRSGGEVPPWVSPAGKHGASAAADAVRERAEAGRVELHFQERAAARVPPFGHPTKSRFGRANDPSGIVHRRSQNGRTGALSALLCQSLSVGRPYVPPTVGSPHSASAGRRADDPGSRRADYPNDVERVAVWVVFPGGCASPPTRERIGRGVVDLLVEQRVVMWPTPSVGGQSPPSRSGLGTASFVPGGRAQRARPCRVRHQRAWVILRAHGQCRGRPAGIPGTTSSLTGARKIPALTRATSLRRGVECCCFPPCQGALHA